jgi:hypothetical protein
MTRHFPAFVLAFVLTTASACSRNYGGYAVVDQEPIGPEDVRNLQDKADTAKWEWSDYDNSLLHCALHNVTAYEVRISRPKVTEHEWEPFRISIFDGATEIYTFRGHSETVFTQIGDVIYVADLSPIATGCSVIAYDLKNRKQLWKCRLKGNPPEFHSRYRHQVNITNDDGVVVVYGKEDNGRYIEYLDARAGKTIGHKQLPPKQ